MTTKHILAGATAATILALSGPAHAGLLGGGAGGGAFGGNLGGGLGGGFSGSRGHGSLTSQGAFDGSLSAPNAHPMAGAVKKSDAQATGAAQAAGSATGTGKTAAANAAAAPPPRTHSGSGSATVDAEHAPGATSMTTNAGGSMN